jgi:hypothetical protein
VNVSLVLSTRSCSWCHVANPVTERWCARCGHAAQLARMLCDCARCSLVFPEPLP